MCCRDVSKQRLGPSSALGPAHTLCTMLRSSGGSIDPLAPTCQAKAASVAHSAPIRAPTCSVSRSQSREFLVCGHGIWKILRLKTRISGKTLCACPGRGCCCSGCALRRKSVGDFYRAMRHNYHPVPPSPALFSSHHNPLQSAWRWTVREMCRFLDNSIRWSPAVPLRSCSISR